MTRSSAHRGPWHADEDQNLLDLVQKQGPNNWVRISQHMQHRTPKQCRERYHQNLKQSLNHDPITHQEGETIEQLVIQMGRRWAEIARRLGNRSDNAVKNWWNGSMNRRMRNGTQRQAGLKSMGRRVQPISATRPPQPAYVQPPPQVDYHQQLRPTASSWSDTHHSRMSLSNRSMHYTEPTTSAVHQAFDPRPFEAERERSQHYSRGHAIAPAIDSFPPLSHHLHPTYSEYLPMPSSLPRTHWRAPQTLHFSNGSSGELPLISPGGSEFSFAPSTGQAPSLVSDRHSTYSVSPKTISSPRSTTLAPIDTRTPLWHDQAGGRRESLPVVQPQHQPSDEGYVSAITPGPIMGLKPYHHVPGYEVLNSHTHNGYRLYQDHLAAPDLSPNSAKDARMHVSSLLH